METPRAGQLGGRASRRYIVAPDQSQRLNFPPSEPRALQQSATSPVSLIQTGFYNTYARCKDGYFSSENIDIK